MELILNFMNIFVHRIDYLPCFGSQVTAQSLCKDNFLTRPLCNFGRQQRTVRFKVSVFCFDKIRVERFLFHLAIALPNTLFTRFKKVNSQSYFLSERKVPTRHFFIKLLNAIKAKGKMCFFFNSTKDAL